MPLQIIIHHFSREIIHNWIKIFFYYIYFLLRNLSLDPACNFKYVELIYVIKIILLLYELHVLLQESWNVEREDWSSGGHFLFSNLQSMEICLLESRLADSDAELIHV